MPTLRADRQRQEGGAPDDAQVGHGRDGGGGRRRRGRVEKHGGGGCTKAVFISADPYTLESTHGLVTQPPLSLYSTGFQSLRSKWVNLCRYSEARTALDAAEAVFSDVQQRVADFLLICKVGLYNCRMQLTRSFESAAWFQPLNHLKRYLLVSKFVFKCNLYRRYGKGKCRELLAKYEL